jgi:hypothetical protein
MLTSPAVDDAAAPVHTDNAPLDPLAVAPDCTDTAPLPPDAPLLAEAAVTHAPRALATEIGPMPLLSKVIDPAT